MLAQSDQHWARGDINIQIVRSHALPAWVNILEKSHAFWLRNAFTLHWKDYLLGWCLYFKSHLYFKHIKLCALFTELGRIARQEKKVVKENLPLSEKFRGVNSVLTSRNFIFK